MEAEPGDIAINATETKRVEMSFLNEVLEESFIRLDVSINGVNEIIEIPFDNIRM